MDRRKFLLVSGGALAWTAGFPWIVLGDRFTWTHPPRFNGIPNYDYQWGKRSASVSAATEKGVMIERQLDVDQQRAYQLLDLARAVQESAVPVQISTAVARRLDQVMTTATGPGANANIAGALGMSPQRIIRMFQMERTHLLIDHCAISEVALQLHRNGCWVLSLRGDQNRRLSDEDAEKYKYRPRLHLRRNEFHVHLRCYSFLATENVPPAEFRAGRPMMASLHPVRFQVQRMEPRYLRMACCDRQIAQYFDYINRVEIEFFYR